MWIEIFPRGVSKSRGVEWLASCHGVDVTDVAAVGNDYNDHDLLDWAGSAYVVNDSPEGLRNSFHRLPHLRGGAVAEAARRWLTGRKHLSHEEPWP